VEYKAADISDIPFNREVAI